MVLKFNGSADKRVYVELYRCQLTIDRLIYLQYLQLMRRGARKAPWTTRTALQLWRTRMLRVRYFLKHTYVRTVRYSFLV